MSFGDAVTVLRPRNGLGKVVADSGLMPIELQMFDAEIAFRPKQTRAD